MLKLTHKWSCKMNNAQTTLLSGALGEKTTRAELRELSPTGEELSMDEIELVGGGACHWTKPSADSDLTCLGGKYD
jgi:hypothetical protein